MKLMLFITVLPQAIEKQDEKISSKNYSKNYNEGWDRIFGAKKEQVSKPN